VRLQPVEVQSQGRYPLIPGELVKDAAQAPNIGLGVIWLIIKDLGGLKERGIQETCWIALGNKGELQTMVNGVPIFVAAI
jgi:hypothetical protein